METGGEKKNIVFILSGQTGVCLHLISLPFMVVLMWSVKFNVDVSTLHYHHCRRCCVFYTAAEEVFLDQL